MNAFQLSFRNLLYRPLASGLSLLLLALGTGLVAMLFQVETAVNEQFTRNVRGIDMVVGAKGSPLQLILSSVYHIDAPTGNIPLAEAEKLARNPLVKKAIPLAYGDSYKSFRIVGTDTTYPGHYHAQLADGQWFSRPLDAVIGARVANTLHLKTGDSFASVHGMAAEAEAHGDHPFTVTGVMQPTGTVLDQLILTPIESLWEVHHHEGEQTEKEITALLIRFKNPMGMMQLPRSINSNTSMQAALPAIEVNRLFDLMGSGMAALRLIGIVVMLVSGLSVFVSLFRSLQERHYELALMRAMGASRGWLFGLLCMEGVTLAALGAILGWLLSRVGLVLFADQINQNFHYELSGLAPTFADLALVLIALGIGFLAALIPAIRAAQTNISRSLAQG